jgi:hypothetical protein
MFDQRTQAERHSRRASSVSIRHAAADQTGELARLAAMDSQRLPDGPWLVAEVEHVPLAVLSLSNRSFVADPFSFTVGLRQLLALRAEQLDDAEWPSRGRLLGRGLRALRV